MCFVCDSCPLIHNKFLHYIFAWSDVWRTERVMACAAKCQFLPHISVSAVGVRCGPHVCWFVALLACWLVVAVVACLARLPVSWPTFARHSVACLEAQLGLRLPLLPLLPLRLNCWFHRLSLIVCLLLFTRTFGSWWDSTQKIKIKTELHHALFLARFCILIFMQQRVALKAQLQASITSMRILFSCTQLIYINIFLRYFIVYFCFCKLLSHFFFCFLFLVVFVL